MRESYSASAFWRPRSESREEWARRSEEFFRLLGECHPSLTRWYEERRSAEESLQLGFEPTREVFASFFAPSKSRFGDGGFIFRGWTGPVEGTHGVTVGVTSAGTALHVSGGANVVFPLEPLGGERLLTRAVVASVMRALAKAWEPDWALATSDELWRQLSLGAKTDTFVGWMTWVPRAYGVVRQVPDPARVEEVDDKGSLVILTPELLRSDSPEHLALARRVQQSLEARGLLRQLTDSQPA